MSDIPEKPITADNNTTTAVVSTPEKVRKPRSTSTQPVELRLPSLTRIDGQVNGTLTLKERFEVVQVWSPGKKDNDVHLTIVGDKATTIGTLKNFFTALIDGYMSSSGLGPDGSCLYVLNVLPMVKKSYPNLFSKGYRIYLLPASRSGTKAYLGSLDEFLSVVLSKAKIIDASKAKFGVGKHISRATGKGEKPEPVISF